MLSYSANPTKLKLRIVPMESSRFCLGLDYGTNTARALIVDASCGAEIAGGVAPYSSGEDGILTDPADPLLARQAPLD